MAPPPQGLGTLLPACRREGPPSGACGAAVFFVSARWCRSAGMRGAPALWPCRKAGWREPPLGSRQAQRSSSAGSSARALPRPTPPHPPRPAVALPQVAAKPDAAQPDVHDVHDSGEPWAWTRNPVLSCPSTAVTAGKAPVRGYVLECVQPRHTSPAALVVAGAAAAAPRAAAEQCLRGSCRIRCPPGACAVPWPAPVRVLSLCHCS